MNGTTGAPTETQSPETKSATVADLPPPSNFRAQIDRWFIGLARGSVQGGAIALKAFFGAAGFHALGIIPSAMDIKTAGAVFLSGAAYHLVDYLTSTPIPEVPS